jgi:hypothetical protein
VEKIRTLLVLSLMVVVVGWFVWGIAPVPISSAAPPAGQVEIIIRNSTFQFQGGVLKPDQPSSIVLRNLDTIQHGFTSPLFENLDVRVETKGVTTYGKGIRGLYLNPGETVMIKFVPMRSGRYPFHCDIHPNMKGELLLLAIGEV